jgi:hypothetical protein
MKTRLTLLSLTLIVAIAAGAFLFEQQHAYGQNGAVIYTGTANAPNVTDTTVTKFSEIFLTGTSSPISGQPVSAVQGTFFVLSGTGASSLYYQTAASGTSGWKLVTTGTGP